MRPAAGRSGMRRGALRLGVAAAGWRWGGAWRGARDYQHFSASGR